MALKIETFSNIKGGNSFFKAAGHPLATEKAKALLERLAAAGPIALYDPLGCVETFAELYDLAALPVAVVFVQDLESIGKTVFGHATRPITEVTGCCAACILVAAFDAERLIHHIQPLLPQGVEVFSLDVLRLPDEMLTNPRYYLDPLNFATNFAFFRDKAGHHTRLVTTNYWAGYGAKNAALWLCLFDEQGRTLAQWCEPLPPAPASVIIDSREVRSRFGLGDFIGSLFLHAIRIANHDVVKYALDTFGDDQAVLSCTHDANAWPADLYAGLPAPAKGERVVLWVQNSHPCPILPKGIGLNRIGSSEIIWLDQEVPPFGTLELDVSTWLPNTFWPAQLEVQAGKHFVRPRYEVFADNGRSRIAHANVERVDLKPDPKIPGLRRLMGKAHLIPASILPSERWRTLVLPTPMATCQRELPIQVIIYDASGREIAIYRFGCLARNHSVAIDIEEIMAKAGSNLSSGYGHLELLYDFDAGGNMDGWLHGLFRYEDKRTGHIAETSFGAHIFNTVLTYRNEPQSYIAQPPGLSTRLFLRLGQAPYDTLCHLIYPASTSWYEYSSTHLILQDRNGTETARRTVHIPCSGSLLWHYSEMFTAEERERAGEGAYVLICDRTCRLFGYHGLLSGEAAFSFDHMFGF